MKTTVALRVRDDRAMTNPRPRRDPFTVESQFPPVLEDAQRGSGAAFEELYNWLAPTVSNYLRTQGVGDYEDLTSEVFLGAFRNIATFSGTAPEFRTWVVSIAHRRVIDERRRVRRRPATVSLPVKEVLNTRQDLEHDVLTRLSTERVQALCADLAPAQRDVLLLRLISDLTIEQIATLLGMTIGGVKALQRRGLASIQNNLRKGVSR